jgi:hypothetical protein
MYYQIISNREIQAKVVAHILKKCGIYINDIEDENNYLLYTFNHWFEDYYRPYINGFNKIILDEPTENELESFINNENWDNKASCNLLDRLFSEYIGKYMPISTLIVVDYPLEDLNNDLIKNITVEDYSSSEKLKEYFIKNCKDWNIIHIDYKKFINDKTYFQEILKSIGLNTDIDIETIYPHYHTLELVKQVKTII